MLLTVEIHKAKEIGHLLNKQKELIVRNKIIPAKFGNSLILNIEEIKAILREAQLKEDKDE